MKQLILPILLAVALAVATLSQSKAAQMTTPLASTPTVWMPIHVATYGEVWKGNQDGTAIESLMFAKQYSHIQFRLVGMFNGDGIVLLSYNDLGDPVEFHYTQPTAMTVDTIVPLGGGTVPIPLSVHLEEYNGSIMPSITNPNLFVGQ